MFFACLSREERARKREPCGHNENMPGRSLINMPELVKASSPSSVYVRSKLALGGSAGKIQCLPDHTPLSLAFVHVTHNVYYVHLAQRVSTTAFVHLVVITDRVVVPKSYGGSKMHPWDI